MKAVDKDLSYRQLHKQYNHATPGIFAMYQMCINFFNVMKSTDNVSDVKAKVMMNTLQANRNEYFVFIRQNKYKCGLNNLSNRLRSVTNMIKKDWIIIINSLYSP